MIRQVDNSNNDYINLLTQGQQKSNSTGQIDEVALLLGTNQDGSSTTDPASGGYLDQAEISPESLLLLQQYQQQSGQVAGQDTTTTAATSAQSTENSQNADRVAYLKQLIQSGGTSSYLNSIDNNTLAESILNHPLAPNLS